MLHRPLNRIGPRLPAQAFRTYAIASPIETHTRPATCREAQCEAWRHGWVTRVDEATPLGQRQAAHIRGSCVPEALAASPAGRNRRRYVEGRDGELTTFTFQAGQPCFAEHRVPLGRPELYVVRNGDWRGDPTGTPPRRHTKPEFWVEDFAQHQQRLADLQEKG